jgi:flagellar biosynthetic protein FlhB
MRGIWFPFRFLMLVATLVLVVAADVPFQLWQYFHKLKMTKEEVKQEMKEMMGDPHVKGRIRSLQMQAARKRMMAAVPKANVVVTNPTHYAVALSYQGGYGGAQGGGERCWGGCAENSGGRPAKTRSRSWRRRLWRERCTNIPRSMPKFPPPCITQSRRFLLISISWLTGGSPGGVYPVPPRNLPVPPELVPEAV